MGWVNETAEKKFERETFFIDVLEIGSKLKLKFEVLNNEQYKLKLRDLKTFESKVLKVQN